MQVGSREGQHTLTLELEQRARVSQMLVQSESMNGDDNLVILLLGQEDTAPGSQLQLKVR